MPTDPYSEAIKEAIVSAPEDVTVIETLELFKDDWADPIYICNDIVDFSATLEAGAPQNASTLVEFFPLTFNIKRPVIGDTGSQNLSVSIDNISLIIFEQIFLADWTAGKLQCNFRLFSTADLSEPGEIIYTQVEGITGTANKFTANCRYSNFIDKLFTRKIYDPVHWPGVHT